MAITDKDFFKTMKHEAKDFGDEFHETFHIGFCRFSIQHSQQRCFKKPLMA